MAQVMEYDDGLKLCIWTGADPKNFKGDVATQDGPFSD